MKFNSTDFTEEHYKDLLLLAKSNYKFVRYKNYKDQGNNVLWRHDIDFSVHRAYALAKIENSCGVNSTYFINIHSEYYNVFETIITNLIFDIISLGHDIGLHFDASYYLNKNINFTYENALTFEKVILEKIFNVQVDTVSFHNPDLGDWGNIDDEIFGGMINTYSSYIKKITVISLILMVIGDLNN